MPSATGAPSFTGWSMQANAMGRSSHQNITLPAGPPQPEANHSLNAFGSGHGASPAMAKVVHLARVRAT